MMHVVRIKDGKATYCNHFVNTLRLQHEKAAGHPVSIKVGSYKKHDLHTCLAVLPV